MSLLDGIRVARSSDPAFRRAACDVKDYYVDVPYEGEIVRARLVDGRLKLYKGGGQYVDLPDVPYSREQISPARDTRLRWMQSVIHCTHYVAGASEQDYLRKDDAPEITYVVRDTIERADEAYVELPRLTRNHSLPLVPIPTTSSSAAVASSPWKSAPAARPTWWSARAASRPPTALPRSACTSATTRRRCWALRWSCSNLTATPGSK